MKLKSPKQEKFAQLVAMGDTYAEAYRQSYPASLKWKETSVWVESSKLMANTNVIQRITELQSKTTEDNSVTLEEVLNQMSRWILFNPQNITNKDGSVKEIHEMTKEDAMSIQSMDITELWHGSGEDRRQVGEIKRIRFVDKRAVATDFLKKFGAFVTTVSIETQDLSHIEAIIKGEVQ